MSTAIDFNQDPLYDWQERFGAIPTAGNILGHPTYSIGLAELYPALQYLKSQAHDRYEMLFDLSAIDEEYRGGGLTVFYHVMSISSDKRLCLRVHLEDDSIKVPSVVALWPNANWYEREVYDMFGIRFEGHPDLRRILTFEFWEGHPLRKSYPCRATVMDQPFDLDSPDFQRIMESYNRSGPQEDGTMILNIGPNHPGTDGVLRLILKLKGETITDIDQEIGFHHRGAEKIAERHTYHNYIPYTDRIDYLGGVASEFPYVLALEQLTNIEVPERAQCIRVMMSEIFRICSHLVWFASLGHNLGAMAPAFYGFIEREKLFDVVEMVCGGRMHPAYFRIGGVAYDLPDGWDTAVEKACQGVDTLLPDLAKFSIKSKIFQTRTQDTCIYTQQMALDWGLTGPNLRATGIDYDVRKKHPYSGYEKYDFDVPVREKGDAYARVEIRFAEIEQSLRIIRQAARNMPNGPIVAPNATQFSFPAKDKTLTDIETLIHSFVDTGKGFNFPVGETFFVTETSKGMTGYSIVSNGKPCPYRLRIRTPSFAHFQSVKAVAKGDILGNLICLIGSIDYVLADIDR